MDAGDHIRSFVRRQGKMTAAQQRSYDKLRDRFCIPFEENRFMQFPDIFPGRNEIILEIGFGMGTVTAEIAENHPENGYIGIEVHSPGVGKLLWEIETRGLENIRIIHDDAIPVIREMFAPESLDGVHIFFPDPWQKKKHRKRRLIQPRFIDSLLQKLKPEAFIYVTTDWEDYALQILQVLSENEGLRNPYPGFAKALPSRPESSFERKGKTANREIFEVYFIKN
jgi:tRNA (guanine-N7-)-methyltransferase